MAVVTDSQKKDSSPNIRSREVIDPRWQTNLVFILLAFSLGNSRNTRSEIMANMAPISSEL